MAKEITIKLSDYYYNKLLDYNKMLSEDQCESIEELIIVIVEGYLDSTSL
jgi:hypothetical protein